MNTLIESLRNIIGEPDFYTVLWGNSPTWDYAAMIEYMVASLIILVTIASVFRFLGKLVSR